MSKLRFLTTSDLSVCTAAVDSQNCLFQSSQGIWQKKPWKCLFQLVGNCVNFRLKLGKMFAQFFSTKCPDLINKLWFVARNCILCKASGLTVVKSGKIGCYAFVYEMLFQILVAISSIIVMIGKFLTFFEIMTKILGLLEFSVIGQCTAVLRKQTTSILLPFH